MGKEQKDCVFFSHTNLPLHFLCTNEIRFFFLFVCSLNVGSISFMRSLEKKMLEYNVSAFFGIPRCLLSSARNLPQWFGGVFFF